MTYLIAGLVLFLGVHSVRVFANDWRTRTLARVGEKPFKGVYALLSIAGFVLLAAAYVPGNQIKAKLHHPMVLGTKVWAFSHLLANGSLADTVLFASFLVWSVLLFAASRRRDRREQVVYPAGTVGMTAVTVAVCFVAWAAFAFWLHRVLIGVAPFGAMG
jgi:uncharacterized membrane protein